MWVSHLYDYLLYVLGLWGRKEVDFDLILSFCICTWGMSWSIGMFICFFSYSMGIKCIQIEMRERAFMIGNNYRNRNAMESEANMYLKQTIAMINSGMSPGRKKNNQKAEMIQPLSLSTHNRTDNVWSNSVRQVYVPSRDKYMGFMRQF